MLAREQSSLGKGAVLCWQGRGSLLARELHDMPIIIYYYAITIV